MGTKLVSDTDDECACSYFLVLVAFVKFCPLLFSSILLPLDLNTVVYVRNDILWTKY